MMFTLRPLPSARCSAARRGILPWVVLLATASTGAAQDDAPRGDAPREPTTSTGWRADGMRIVAPGAGDDESQAGELPGYYRWYLRAGDEPRLPDEIRRDESPDDETWRPRRERRELPSMRLLNAAGERVELLRDDGRWTVVLATQAWWCLYCMRQLVEVQEHAARFADLGARVVAVCQKDTDSENLPRVENLVGPGIEVLADPDQVSLADLPLFGAYIVDPQGHVRVAFPGTKGARVRADRVLDELARLRGVSAPSVQSEPGAAERASDAEPGALRGEQALSIRWAFSHDRVRPGDVLRLFVLPQLVPGWAVSAGDGAGEHAFRVDVATPPGLVLQAPPALPAPGSVPLADGTRAPAYTGDIPVAAMDFVAATSGLPLGQQSILVTLGYEPIVDGERRAPVERTYRLPIRFDGAGVPRGQLYGWESW